MYKNAPQEGDSGLDPSILLDWVPEGVFSSPSNLLQLKPSSLLSKAT